MMAYVQIYLKTHAGFTRFLEVPGDKKIYAVTVTITGVTLSGASKRQCLGDWISGLYNMFMYGQLRD